ncbi:hypothetical protein Pla52n_06380 [Stieleria varia]|uniref:Uncharacterized protein n=2 Tax=Stieleria varia TaxID=2528005 RepID=A0A5C6B8G5_9BACT|nr:hypothetical protein Pla52n_06380 [Stieleria varia]
MGAPQQSVSVTRCPSRFQFAIANRIEFLNPVHWDAVTAGASVFLSRNYLSATQDDFGSEVVRDFALIYDGPQPVAAIATQSFDITGKQLVAAKSDGENKFSAELKRKSLSMLKRRVCLCGNVHTWGMHGVAFAPDCDPSAIWPGVADCLYRIRRANRLHGQTDYVIIKDLFADQHAHAGSLASYRYKSFETEPNMVLTINPQWKTIDDYFVSLTKRYRAAAKKVFKPFDADGLSVSSLVNVAEHSDRVHALYHAVASKADVCLFPLSSTTLPRIAEALGDDFATIGIFEHDHLVGFVTVVRDGPTAIGYYIGIDYGANARLPIYHRLLLAVIDQAITWGCQNVSFGRTALDAKSRLGCQPEDTHVWVRHRVPLVNVFVQQVLKNVSHAEPPDRNPFKEAQ